MVGSRVASRGSLVRLWLAVRESYAWLRKFSRRIEGLMAVRFVVDGHAWVIWRASWLDARGDGQDSRGRDAACLGGDMMD